MKSLTTTKKIMTIIALSLTASLVIPFALASHNSSDPPVPVIPSQCTADVASGWTATPIINARMNVVNNEDGGVVGYWALDNYAESFVIWQNTGTTPNTFCALQQYTGSWATFAGALSPQTGFSQPYGAFGPMSGASVTIFTGSFLGPYCKPRITTQITRSTSTATVTTVTYTITRQSTTITTQYTQKTRTVFTSTTTSTQTCSGEYSTKPLTGDIGWFNLGGEHAQILLGTYARQAAFTPLNVFTYYFAPGYTIVNVPVWSWVYTNGNGVGYGNMWVNSLSGSFGDIVT